MGKNCKKLGPDECGCDPELMVNRGESIKIVYWTTLLGSFYHQQFCSVWKLSKFLSCGGMLWWSNFVLGLVIMRFNNMYVQSLYRAGRSWIYFLLVLDPGEWSMVQIQNGRLLYMHMLLRWIIGIDYCLLLKTGFNKSAKSQ